MKTFYLWLVDIITWKSCVFDEAIANATAATATATDNKCENQAAKQQCKDLGGRCNIDIDGYYIEIIINVVYGIIWYQWGKRVLEQLQNLKRHEWHVLSKQPAEEEEGDSILLDGVRNKV